MPHAYRSIAAGTLLALAASSVMALGFGRVSNTTVLGRPLAFTVPLRFDADEFVSVECVSADVLAGDDVKIPAANVRVSLDPSGDPNAPLLRVSTASIIDEPIVTVSVSVGCPVRLQRKFVAFIDPPALNLAQSEAPANEGGGEAAPTAPPPKAAAPSVATARPAPQRRAAAPAVPQAPRETQAERRPRPPRAVVARAPARPASAAASAPTPSRAASEPAVRAAAAPASAGGGARLQLEAPEMLAAAKPASGAAPAVAAATPAAAPASALQVQALPPAATAAASAAPAATPAEAPSGDRLRELEASLAALKADNEAMRRNLNGLQSRLREPEPAALAANPLLYALLGLVAALVLALVGVVMWARKREREREAWWGAAAAAQASGAASAVPSQPPAMSAAERAAALVSPESVGPAGWRHTVEIPELDAADVPRRAVSAEELIDLEQQAEFFVTLGQDDAAVDLLLNHIASVGGISPLPYLKLLEIHRRRGDRDAYERVREQFNQRFNAYAPGWDDPAAPERSLEDDAAVMARLQSAWPQPMRAMAVLEPLLFRQAAGDALFDLAAYREVLFLYEVARDLAEHSGNVGAAAASPLDIELPFDDGGAVISYPTSPMRNTMPVPPASGAARPLAVDVELDAVEEPERPHERTEPFDGGSFSSFSAPVPPVDPNKPSRR